MNDLYTELKQWGCDVDGALQRFIYDDELYKMCLIKFKDDENFVLLEKAMLGGNYISAFESAHTLKGVAGNLGLTPLCESISIVVERLRINSYDGIEDLYEEINNQYKRYCNLVC
ncbi:Hpt domain-containing protein [Lachnospiraceae bacterium LCP25S3_G4]